MVTQHHISQEDICALQVQIRSGNKRVVRVVLTTSYVTFTYYCHNIKLILQAPVHNTKNPSPPSQVPLVVMCVWAQKNLFD